VCLKGADRPPLTLALYLPIQDCGDLLSGRRKVVVAFRGSSSLANLLVDIRFARLRVPHARFRPKARSMHPPGHLYGRRGPLRWSASPIPTNAPGPTAWSSRYLVNAR
jgi:hypothetical protein